MTRHHDASGESDHGDVAGLDWWRLLDAAVWVSVGILGILAIEWMFGKFVREKLAGEAAKHLRAAVTASDD